MSYEVIVNLIASTTAQQGLVVKAAINTNTYKTGGVISHEQLARVDFRPAKFYGEWNYVIRRPSM